MIWLIFMNLIIEMDVAFQSSERNDTTRIIRPPDLSDSTGVKP